MLNEYENALRKNKTILLEDTKSGNYVHYNMSLKEGVEEATLNCFFNFLYSMKLDSGLSNRKVFKEDKSTGDLVKGLLDMLSAPVINFSWLMNLYSDEEVIMSSAVSKPLNEFLNMFDFTSPVVYTEEDLKSITKSIKHGLTFSDKNQAKNFMEEMIGLKTNSYFIDRIGFKPNQRENKAFVK